MPLYIRAVCEQVGCDLGYTYSFDHVAETYGELLVAMRTHGWRFELNDKAQPERMACPEHHDVDAKETA